MKPREGGSDQGERKTPARRLRVRGAVPDSQTQLKGLSLVAQPLLVAILTTPLAALVIVDLALTALL